MAEVDTAELDFLHLALVAVALEWVPLVLKAEGAFQVSEAAAVVGVNQVLTVVVVAEVTLQA